MKDRTDTDQVETARIKLNMARWTLRGMLAPDYDHEKRDISHVLVMVDGIDRDLEEALKGGKV